MKKLNIKSFWIILWALVGTIVCRFADLVQMRNRNFPRLEERMDPQKLERLSTALFRLNFVGAIILTLVVAYFIYRLFANKKTAQGQKYITFLFVINIIVGVGNILSLIVGTYSAIISLAINILIIVGCHIQKNYSEPTPEN